MWYWLGASAVVMGGAVFFGVLDFLPWGLVAVGLFLAGMKMQPKFPPRAYK